MTLELQEAGGQARVRVVDSGKGIAKEDIPYIFDRFFSGGRSGTGRGSVFYFDLPLNAAPDRQV